MVVLSGSSGGVLSSLFKPSWETAVSWCLPHCLDCYCGLHGYVQIFFLGCYSTCRVTNLHFLVNKRMLILAIFIFIFLVLVLWLVLFFFAGRFVLIVCFYYGL